MSFTGGNTGWMGTGALAPSTPAPSLAGRPPQLRAVPPAPLPPSTGLTSGPRGVSAASLMNAIRFNVATERSASVAPTATTDPNVGQPGSTGQAGNIAGASGNIGYAVETLHNWQAANPGLGKALKIGLPIAGIFLLTKGHYVAGGIVAGAGALLWM